MSNAAVAAPLTQELARLEPLRPLPVHSVKSAMTEYQTGLHEILDESDWQVFPDRSGERRFVKRSGWRKISTWLALDLEVKTVSVERDDNGNPLRALVIGRAVAPNGRKAEDIGACSLNERRFSKPEHDLIAVATTRALNRATANLVGMGELVSAEEIADDDTVVERAPEWAQNANAELIERMRGQLHALVGSERGDALSLGIENRYSGVPNIVTGIVNALHKMLVSQTTASASGEGS